MPNSVAFELFGIPVMWYGILIAFGMILAMAIVYLRATRHDVNREDLIDVFIVAIPFGIIGARLYYVIFNWDYYGNNLGEILNYRGGGLAIHGGLILGGIAVWIVCRYKKINILNALDLIVPAVALAQSIGRWGNYMNGEAHGGPTNLPWAITVDGIKVHPTFLYESIWCFFLFVLLIVLDNREHFEGKIACLYAILYSVERFFVEGLRTDSLMIGPLKQAQVFSLCVIIIAIGLYLILKKKNIKTIK